MKSLGGTNVREHAYALFESCIPEAESIVLERNEEGKILAPNGEISELGHSELLCKIVRTKTFKHWFGDWESDPDHASKAVYPSTGEPRIVFHATPKSIPMEEGLKPMLSDSWDHEVTYFSYDPFDAGMYARFWERETKSNTVTYPCFLNIRHPLVKDPQKEDYDGFIEGQYTLHFAVRSKDQILHIPFNAIHHNPAALQ